MAKFLNREGILNELNKLFGNAQKDIMIVVPFIKLSDSTFEMIQKADKRGVQITIIYKINKLLDADRIRLGKLKNLNLLTHPDIHAKCYANESKVIIGSMNLYEYSEKYNREMAIMIDKEEDSLFSFDDANPFDEAIAELKNITNSATLEKKSAVAVRDGFNLKILRDKREIIYEACKYINKYFDNKKFETSQRDEDIICFNYYNNIDIVIDLALNENVLEESAGYKVHRVVIKPKWQPNIISRIHFQFKKYTKNPNSFPLFIVYWNGPESTFAIYRNKDYDKEWIKFSNEQTIEKFKYGIHDVVSKVLQFEQQLR